MNAANASPLPPAPVTPEADSVSSLSPVSLGLSAIEGPLQELVASGKLNTLDLDQKRLLAAFLEYGITKQAHDFTGISKQRHNRWLATNSVYADACKMLGTGLLMETAVRLDQLLPKAAEALEDALDAEKTAKVDVTCPCGCDHTFTVQVPIADLKLRVDVAKSVLNRAGEMGTIRHKIEGKVEHEVTQATLEERVLLRQIERGMPVPDALVERLRQKGLLLGAPQGGEDSEARYNRPGPGPEVIDIQVLPAEAE